MRVCHLTGFHEPPPRSPPPSLQTMRSDTTRVAVEGSPEPGSSEALHPRLRLQDLRLHCPRRAARARLHLHPHLPQ